MNRKRKIKKAIAWAKENRQTFSVCGLQRYMKIGIDEAWGICDELERRGKISGHNGHNYRKVYI